MYPRTHGRFPILMNRPTSHPEQQLLLVRVSDTNNDENTKLIVSSFHRHHEDANNNSTASPSSSDISDIQIIISTLNINLEDVVKFFDEHLNTSYIFTRGPEPIRQHLIPLFVQNEHFVPHQLLDYFDINVIMDNIEEGQEDDDSATARFILNLKDDELEKTHRVVNIDYKSAPITLGETSDLDCDNLICRARGLPWQASDQHVAQFFAGLDIVPGGIALCLSSEGRRNGEALVQFANQESRDLALKRHRNFLLSRYIEVYKATMDEFLHVASGSSTEAMEFVSANAVIIRMRGLPYDCTEVQIKAFFEPLRMLDKILFISRSDGRPTGDAFVQFESEDDATQALLKHRHTIGQRYIELFKSTAAEVQQVVKRCNQINNSTTTSSNVSEHSDEKRKDCIRLRGLPYEAQVPNIVTFLGDYAKMVKYQGVHMIFNNQGNPSGEAFIQMINEQAAAATALSVHNKFMVIGKKQRYIEVFQCSAEDLNLQHLVKPAQVAAAPPPQTMAFMGHPPLFTQPQQQQFWSSYPSPPISPIVPGQLSQFVIYGIGPGCGIPELVAQFSSPEGIVENVIFTRLPTPVCPGEAIITIRSRAPPPPQLAHLHNYPFQQQQFLHQQPIIMEQ